jgi:hypothetical protein
MIKVREHLQLLQRILARHQISVECFELVPDVQEWCKARGVEERNPFRAAKCFATELSCHIVMRDVQTDSMVRSAKNSMEFDGFGAEVERLETDKQYLSHLLLHEIACFKLRTTEQAARDRWAFAELAHAAKSFDGADLGPHTN